MKFERRRLGASSSISDVRGMLAASLSSSLVLGEEQYLKKASPPFRADSLPALFLCVCRLISPEPITLLGDTIVRLGTTNSDRRGQAFSDTTDRPSSQASPISQTSTNSDSYQINLNPPSVFSIGIYLVFLFCGEITLHWYPPPFFFFPLYLMSVTLLCSRVSASVSTTRVGI